MVAECFPLQLCAQHCRGHARRKEHDVAPNTLCLPRSSPLECMYLERKYKYGTKHVLEIMRT